MFALYSGFFNCQFGCRSVDFITKLSPLAKLELGFIRFSSFIAKKSTQIPKSIQGASRGLAFRAGEGAAERVGLALRLEERRRQLEDVPGGWAWAERGEERERRDESQNIREEKKR